MYKSKNKNAIVLVLLILMGIVIGGFIGEGLKTLTNDFQTMSFLKWINYGMDFGVKTPLFVDLGIISFTLGFTIKFTVSGILCVIAAVFIYRKM